MSAEDKQNVIHEKFVGGKIVSPHEMLCLLRKNENNRMWILKQLSQLGIDIHLLEDYSLSDLYRHCDQIIKSTYSIKYLGMNQNEMGIISRRIDPFKDNKFTLKQLPQTPYTVNKFFFPKPLKVGRKSKKEENINPDNLQSQIKKAFLKNNPVNAKKKMKQSQTPNGSWMNASSKFKHREKQEPQSSENFKKLSCESKHDLSNQLSFPNLNKLKKLGSSYSRFLSSGLVFSTLQKQ